MRRIPDTWLAHPASLQADALAEIGWVLVVGMAAVFLLTMALLALALRRGRKRPVGTRTWLVGLGLAFPATVLGALLVYGVWRTAGLERPPADALVIAVTGHLWWWEVRYFDPDGGGWIAAANELRLPAGRPVRLGLSSADVIHSFWAPELGGKMDLVPGRTNHLVITARTPGTFRASCAEFCGTQHARMALPVVVMPADEHARWLARQVAPAAAPVVAAAPEAFIRHCAGCHAVRGLPGSGAPLPVTLGPDLTHVGSRLQLAAGTLANDHAALERWIADPQAIKPGARMPGFAHLGADTVAALAAYLASLQ